jgi:nucleotide-binding universal stress UspA family protein
MQEATVETKVLVPLDGTEIGEAVLPKLDKLVFQAMPKADAEVTLLHVISQVNFSALTEDPKAQLPIPKDDLRQLTDKAYSYLDEVARGIARQGIRVKTMVRVGNAADEIVKAANATGANLIAMSTHGRNGVVRWMLGSVTDRVIRLEGTIPVLAISAKAPNESSPVIAMDSLQSLMKQPS